MLKYYENEYLFVSSDQNKYDIIDLNNTNEILLNNVEILNFDTITKFKKIWYSKENHENSFDIGALDITNKKKILINDIRLKQISETDIKGIRFQDNYFRIDENSIFNIHNAMSFS